MWFVVISMFCECCKVLLECCAWCFFSSTTINPLLVFVQVLHLALHMVFFSNTTTTLHFLGAMDPFKKDNVHQKDIFGEFGSSCC
jgi:hypothetical protein